MIYSILRKIKGQVNIMMWLTIILALLIVSGVYTYARYTYHTQFTGVTVTVPATKCSNLGLTLSDCVIAFGGKTTNIETAKANIEDKGTPDYSTTATTDEGMYAAEDDYGTSYYFRGAVENNYVEYAGYIWRIIRVNGDGSVRMIYDGTSAHANGESDTDRYYTASAFNSSYNDNMYVGYMYGSSGSTYSKVTTSTTVTLQEDYYYYASSYTSEYDSSLGYVVYTLTNPTQEVWNSSLSGYYTCKSNTETSCTTLYYMEAYANNYQACVSARTCVESNVSYCTYTSTACKVTLEGIEANSDMAQRLYYGTGYTFNEETGVYTLTDYDYDVWSGDGSLVGYYTCASEDDYTCDTMYYIESVESDTDANVIEYTSTLGSYEETHSNDNDSTIKGVIDSFYTTKIQGQVDDNGNSLEDYLSDEIFCNDRSLYSGTGIGTTVTYYSGYDRLLTNKSPALTCTNQNDEFTVDTTTSGDGTAIGNGDLTYPIGLITADESAMAGGVYFVANTSYYLYTGSYYWTMTTSNFSSSNFYELAISGSGYLYNGGVMNNSMGVRPVINLGSDVYVYSGTGKMDDPYEVTLDNPNTLSKKMLLNSTGESTVEDAIATIEAKGDPDFNEMAPIATILNYTDNLPTRITTITASSITMTSYSSRYYTYADDYEFDEETGKYSLVDAEVGQYSSIYSDLGGKYVVSYSGSTSSTAATSTNLSTIYYVTTSTTSSKLYYISSTTTTNYEYDYSGDGLYAAKDDYGTSYYYRGAVENNYVEYAGYIWRIIRRNGDGSVRMIYDGTSAHDNGTSSTNRYYTTSAFNSSYSDNAYVGYMYGTTSASTYDEAHTNTNDSTIKGVIDRFYTTKIQGQVDDNGNSLEDYLSDEIFCNDRSLYSGTGYSTTTSYYYGYNRLSSNKKPVLTCTNQNDAFTVSDTTNGNGDLTYPIGLITADEVAMAGGVYNTTTTNSGYYLYMGSSFWTMTPSFCYGSIAYESIVYPTGYIGSTGVFSTTGARPVVNLSSEVLVESGTGTKDDPYTLTLSN